MTIHVYYFDKQGNCTNPKMESLQTIVTKNGFWLNEPFSLLSCYIDMSLSNPIWCIINYISVYHAGPVNIALDYLYNMLDAILNTANIDKHFYVSNYKDVLQLYQTYDSLKAINDLLLPQQMDNVKFE